ncbi:hypothetical protein AOQ84DRAFT_219851 [Glonium stellatum]|uniref:Uncharacterized protein n=1 Tax=Glonium stellatum TaxID=574774 RepID=A0A8E2F4N5_9PEZI|nr:hypothetical protein AOQ84DRAFT_219851 [Glonium stellatum]
MDDRGKDPTPQSPGKIQKVSEVPSKKSSDDHRQLRRSVATESLMVASDEKKPAFYPTSKSNSLNIKPTIQPDSVSSSPSYKPGSWSELPAWVSSSHAPTSVQTNTKGGASFSARSFSYWSRDTVADEGAVQIPLGEMWEILLETNAGFRLEMYKQGIISDTDYFTSSQLCTPASPPSSPLPILHKYPSHQSLRPEHAPLKEVTQATGYGQKNIELLENLRSKDGAGDNEHASSLLAAQTQRRRKEIHDERHGLAAPESYAERAIRRYNEHLKLGKDAFSHEPATGDPPKQPWSEIDEQKFSLFQISENPHQNFPSTIFTKEEYSKAAKEGYKGPNVLAFVNTKTAMERDENVPAMHGTQLTHFYCHPNIDISHELLPDGDRRASPSQCEVEDNRPISYIDDRMTFCVRHPSQNPYMDDGRSVHSNSSHTPMEDAQTVSVARAGPGTDTPTTAINVGKEENASNISEPSNPFSGKKPTLAASPSKPTGHPEPPTTPVKSSKYSEEREHPLHSKWSSPATPITPPKFGLHGRTKSSDSMRSPTIMRSRGNSLITEPPTAPRGSKGKGKVIDSDFSPVEHGLTIATAIRSLDEDSILTAIEQISKGSRSYVSEGMQTDNESGYTQKSDDNTFTAAGLFRALQPIWPSGIPENILYALPEMMDHIPFSPGPYMPLYTGRGQVPADCPKSHRYLAYLAERLASFKLQLDENQNQAIMLAHYQHNMENDLNMLQDERTHLSKENKVLRAYCDDLEKLLKHINGPRVTPEEFAPIFQIAQRLGLTIPGPVLAGPNPVGFAQRSDRGAALSDVTDVRVRSQSRAMLNMVVQNMKLQQDNEDACKEAAMWKERAKTWEKRFSKEVGKAALSLYGDLGDNPNHRLSTTLAETFSKHDEQAPFTDSHDKAPDRDIGAGAGPSNVHPQQQHSYFAGGTHIQPPGFQRSDSSNMLLGYPPAGPAASDHANIHNGYGGPRINP